MHGRPPGNHDRRDEAICFRLRALWSSGNGKKRLIEILSGDPAIGVIYDENAALWIWNFAAYDVFYAIRDDISKLVLIELRPHSEAKVKLIKRLFDVVEKVNAFKRLFGF